MLVNLCCKEVNSILQLKNTLLLALLVSCFSSGSVPAGRVKIQSPGISVEANGIHVVFGKARNAADSSDSTRRIVPSIKPLAEPGDNERVYIRSHHAAEVVAHARLSEMVREAGPTGAPH